jgi:hypothetical protein
MAFQYSGLKRERAVGSTHQSSNVQGPKFKRRDRLLVLLIVDAVITTPTPPRREKKKSLFNLPLNQLNDLLNSFAKDL